EVDVEVVDEVDVDVEVVDVDVVDSVVVVVVEVVDEVDVVVVELVILSVVGASVEAHIQSHEAGQVLVGCAWRL
ncbi:unnamed protein product, partial [Rotaria sordida]